MIVNLSTTLVTGYGIGLPRAGRWRLRCNTDAPLYGEGLGCVHADDLHTREGWSDGHPQWAPVDVGPYAALVYSQDE